MYYVYRYIRLDTNTPFYVGKGNGKRAYSTQHNDYCKRIADKHGFKIEYIQQNLTEEQSLAKEVEFIKIYKDLGYCEANFTNGGEGISGYKHTVEAKEKMSKSAKGNTNGFKKGNSIAAGYKHTESTKAKISAAQLGKNKPKLSLEHMEKLSVAKQGRTFSESTKAKMSDASKKAWIKRKAKKEL